MSEYAIPRAGQELYQCSRTDKYQLKALHHFEQFVRHIPYQTVASISFVNSEHRDKTCGSHLDHARVESVHDQSGYNPVNRAPRQTFTLEGHQ